MMLNHPDIAFATLAAESKLAAARADRFGPRAAVGPPPVRGVPRRRLTVGRIAAEWRHIVPGRVAAAAARKTMVPDPFGNPGTPANDVTEHLAMRTMPIVLIVAALAAAVAGVATPRIAAKVAAPTAEARHPFVGTWIVDTISAADTDSPEVAVVTADGLVVGQGATRVAAGTWEAIDDRTAMLTLVSVFDRPEGAGYIVVRGPHQVDETGNAWTCACTFTVVGADGSVLDSGDAPADARRLPLQGPEMAGQPLGELPAWTPPVAATPAS